MEKLQLDTEQERLNLNSGIEVPISIDLLNAGLGLPTSLPESLAKNPKLQSEVESRTRLADRLSSVFDRIGERDLDQAVQEGLIQESEADEIYEDLTEFISEDPENNVRIVLYLPFQILPDLNQETSPSSQKFAAALHDGFIRLLFESEPRASFNDGDVLEPGLGIPERTRKVAHLTPEFLSRAILQEKEIRDLLEIVGDNEIIQALNEGLAFTSSQESASDDEKQENVDEIFNDFSFAIVKINGIYTEGSPHIKNFSAKRVIWEKNVKIDEAITLASSKLASKIINGEIMPNEVETRFGSVTAIRSITKAVEILAKENFNDAQNLIENYQSLLFEVWENGSKTEKGEVASSVNHLYRLNLFQASFVQKMGVRIPDLSQPLPIDLNEFVEDGGKFIAESVQKIVENPLLSKNLHPFILVFGSRLKGYSSQDSDFDMAIFFKPDAKYEDRDLVLSELKKVAPEIANLDKVLEYWTNQEDGHLGSRPIPEDAPGVIIGARDVQFLVEGAWIGNRMEINRFKGDIVQKYLDLSRFGAQKDETRMKFLRQIELSVLQFRLMHKGFRALYPLQERTDKKNGELVDWKSDFWDPEFRRIATQLFLKKVFLPDLSANLGK